MHGVQSCNMMQNGAVTHPEMCHIMIDINTHHALLLLVRLKWMTNANWDIRVWKNKRTQNKPHNLNPRIRIDEGLIYSNFVLPVAFLKPVPAVLTVPEEVNFGPITTKAKNERNTDTEPLPC